MTNEKGKRKMKKDGLVLGVAFLSAMLLIGVWFYSQPYWVPEKKGFKLNKEVCEGSYLIEDWRFVGLSKMGMWNWGTNETYVSDCLLLERQYCGGGGGGISRCDIETCHIPINATNVFSFDFGIYHFQDCTLFFEGLLILKIENMSWYEAGHWEQHHVSIESGGG